MFLLFCNIFFCNSSFNSLKLPHFINYLPNYCETSSNGGDTPPRPPYYQCQCSANVTKIEQCTYKHLPFPTSSFFGRGNWSVFVWWSYAPQYNSDQCSDQCPVPKSMGGIPPIPPFKCTGFALSFSVQSCWTEQSSFFGLFCPTWSILDCFW